MPGAMDLGIADDRECSGHEQAAQIAVPLFADAAEPLLAPTRMLPGNEPNPGPRSYVRIGGSWGQQHLRPERSPTWGRPRGCNEGACSSGWTGAKPGSSDRTPRSAA